MRSTDNNSKPKSGAIEYKFKIVIKERGKGENEDFNSIPRSLNQSILSSAGRYYFISEGLFYSILNQRNFQNLNPSDTSFVREAFILNCYKRQFKFIDGAKTFFSNYEEKEGSFVMSFSILVIGTIVNYGSIRETIDYFRTDLETIFEEMLPQFEISSTYKMHMVFDASNILDKKNVKTDDENLQYSEGSQTTLAVLEKLIAGRNKVLYVLLTIMFVFLLAISLYVLNMEAESKDLDAQIDQKIEDKIRNNKIDNLLQEKENRPK